MSPEENKAKDIEDALKKHDAELKAADARKRADAEASANAGEKLDKILECLDSLSTRMDAYESKDKGNDEEKEEKGDPKPLGADSVRSDSAVVAAADLEEVEHYKSIHGAVHKIAADSVLASIQADANRASSAWGKDAVHPWEGERIVAYRRRCAKQHQQHSPNWKNVDLHELSGQALRNATQQIYADSIAASSSPESYPDTLIERHVRDPISGQKRIEFYGSPSAWTDQFKSGRQYVTKFRTPGLRQD